MDSYLTTKIGIISFGGVRENGFYERTTTDDRFLQDIISLADIVHSKMLYMLCITSVLEVPLAWGSTLTARKEMSKM